MEAPMRITLSRKKGWRMPPNTVKVCRPSKYGNPFRSADFHYGEGPVPRMNDWMVDLFKKWLEAGQTDRSHANPPPTYEEIRKDLAGKNLACWCKQGEACHADVLLKIANG